MALVITALVLAVGILAVALMWALATIRDQRHELETERRIIAAALADHEQLQRDRVLMAEAEIVRDHMRHNMREIVSARLTASDALYRLAEIRAFLAADATVELRAIEAGDRR